MTDMTNDAVKSFNDSEMLVNVWDGMQGILSSSHWIILFEWRGVKTTVQGSRSCEPVNKYTYIIHI